MTKRLPYGSVAHLRSDCEIRPDGRKNRRLPALPRTKRVCRAAIFYATMRRPNGRDHHHDNAHPYALHRAAGY